MAVLMKATQQALGHSLCSTTFQYLDEEQTSVEISVIISTFTIGKRTGLLS